MRIAFFLQLKKHKKGNLINHIQTLIQCTEFIFWKNQIGLRTSQRQIDWLLSTKNTDSFRITQKIPLSISYPTYHPKSPVQKYNSMSFFQFTPCIAQQRSFRSVTKGICLFLESTNYGYGLSDWRHVNKKPF